jgi:hypothetical protein
LLTEARTLAPGLVFFSSGDLLEQAHPQQGGAMIGRCLLAGLLLLISSPAFAEAPQLAGVSPAAAAPGASVTVLGGPFTQEVRIVFGDRQLVPVRAGEKQLSFIVPQLPEGDYLLFLQAGEEISGRSLFFRIVLPSPEILAIDPQQIDACTAGGRRQVTVKGRNLQPGVRLLLDGVSLAARPAGSDTLVITVPDMAPGLHQVQLANPDGRISLPAALLIDNSPEIQSVVWGEEMVTSYQLMISGKNFSYKSVLLVNGRQISSFYPGALTVDGRQFIPINPGQLGMDSLQYVDCNTLIYVRHPYSSQPKSISLQVVNPDGRESSVYTFTGP